MERNMPLSYVDNLEKLVQQLMAENKQLREALATVHAPTSLPEPGSIPDRNQAFGAPQPPTATMDSVYDRPFPSHDAALAAITDVSRQLGYSLVVHQKKPSAVKPRRIVLRCCQGRPYVSQANPTVDESKRRRRTSHRTVLCPYRIAIKLLRNGSWLPYKIKTEGASEHNHEASNPGVFPKYRIQGLRQRHDDIVAWWDNGVKMFEMMARLGEDPDPIVRALTRNDLRNYLRRLGKIDAQEPGATGSVEGIEGAEDAEGAESAEESIESGDETAEANVIPESEGQLASFGQLWS